MSDNFLGFQKNSKRRLHILVIYSGYTTRTSLLDTLYSFRNYTRHRVYYINIAIRRIPQFLYKIKFDLIIFHTLFFSKKFDRKQQLAIFDKIYGLIKHPSRKVLIPQDEFINSDIVCNFIKKIDADAVFSVQPESEWDLIYKNIDRKKTKIHRVLTGYLDSKRVRYCAKFLDKSWQRNIWIGYRCIGKPVPWFGRHGYLKEKIAIVFENACRFAGIDCDISTEDKDAIVGLGWYDFLGNCQYVLGVEGGTSIHDEKGSIKLATEEFNSEYPDASFEEIESACFPNIDGNFHGFAISPRHLEACMTGTCQILTEGYYSGVLMPNVHYIPVSKDLSNVDEVISLVKSDCVRNQIITNAYRDIVLSGKYDIKQFAKTVIGEISLYPSSLYVERLEKLKMLVIYCILFVLDKIDRFIAISYYFFKSNLPKNK